MYVGITRAKRQCILSGTLDWEGDARLPKPPAGSLLEVLLDGVGVQGANVITSAHLATAETPLLSDAPARPEGRGRLAQVRLRSGEPMQEVSTHQQLAEPLHANEHRTERLIGTITHRILELLAGAETLPTPDDPQVAMWIERNARFSPQKVAIYFEGRAITYADLAAHIDRAAQMLAGSLGVQHGDRVSLLATNIPEYLVALFACARIGAILNQLKWRLAIPELAYIVENAESSVLLIEQAFADFAVHVKGVKVVA